MYSFWFEHKNIIDAILSKAFQQRNKVRET